MRRSGASQTPVAPELVSAPLLEEFVAMVPQHEIPRTVRVNVNAAAVGLIFNEAAFNPAAC